MTSKQPLSPKPYGSPVVGYVRSPRLNDPALDEAEAQIRAYCAEQGWNLAKIFREEGVSSVAAWRPQFEGVVRGLKQREWVGLVLVCLDSLSSNGQVRARLVSRVKLHGWITVASEM